MRVVECAGPALRVELEIVRVLFVQDFSQVCRNAEDCPIWLFDPV